MLALALAGCGGGSSGGGRHNTGDNSSLPNVVVMALTGNNRLNVFNARTPDIIQPISITGLRDNERLIGIDYRYPNATFAGTSLYGLGNLNGSLQLYQIAIADDATSTATAVGTPFTTTPALGTIAFDFNPVADRIRVVDTASGLNLRLDPNSGAVLNDTKVAYATTDVNTGKTPLVAGAAYNNNDREAATRTVNYAIDTAQGTLVSQGDSVDGTTISPNTGQLFTIGALSTKPGSADVGFDITPTGLGADSNRALVAFAPQTGGSARLYEVSLSNGQLSGGALINIGQIRSVLDIAVTNIPVAVAAAKR